MTPPVFSFLSGTPSIVCGIGDVHGESFAFTAVIEQAQRQVTGIVQLQEPILEAAYDIKFSYSLSNA